MIKHILLADDDRDDRFFFDKAVSEIKQQVHVDSVMDGEQLMLWLLKNTDNLPDIIFLDLNMPRKNGFECLEEIRHNKYLKHLFIAIYSTSISQKDIDEAFAKGANIFVNKPNGFEDLKTIISKVLELNLEEYAPNAQRISFVLSGNR